MTVWTAAVSSARREVRVAVESSVLRDWVRRGILAVVWGGGELLTLSEFYTCSRGPDPSYSTLPRAADKSPNHAPSPPNS